MLNPRLFVVFTVVAVAVLTPVSARSQAVPASSRPAATSPPPVQSVPPVPTAAPGSSLTAEQAIREAIQQSYNMGLSTGLQMQARVGEMVKETDGVKSQLSDAKRELEAMREKCGAACAGETVPVGNVDKPSSPAPSPTPSGTSEKK
jgi:hypothetical protein